MMTDAADRRHERLVGADGTECVQIGRDSGCCTATKPILGTDETIPKQLEVIVSRV
jgi:hypothetical protein